eukprot:TRINITY_DN28762_c0_g1_i1.p3 TRINITY_DN28762_c0_g1~~TRINITY_DN28762_c0_g1_i1.p3  ORF type:complete len:115 (+),score=21.56 TRINITY_DN28762_c0_g1_i1:150-494(+)
MGLFSRVDDFLNEISGGQIRRPQPGEKECMQCRAVGTLVFTGAAVHAGMEAIRSRPKSGNRMFFIAVSGVFAFAGAWRAITPTVPLHHGEEAPASGGAAGSSSTDAPADRQSPS